MQRRGFLQAAAAVAGVAAGDAADTEIVAQQDCLLRLADRDDNECWEYETACNLAPVRSGLLNAELDSLCGEPVGVVETLAVGRNGISLGFEISTNEHEPIGTLVSLKAEQTEALAVELIEQAHAARETKDD
jgi:hypothetical protein